MSTRQAIRRRIIAETTQVLLDRGYAGTTAEEICRRSEISEETLTVHFATLPKLLVATLQHALGAVVLEFVSQGSEISLTTESLTAKLWTQWQKPPVTLWLELAVASRTNAELRELMRAMMLGFDQLIAQTSTHLLDWDALPEDWKGGLHFFVLAVLNGALAAQCYEAPGQEQRILGPVNSLFGMLWPPDEPEATVDDA